MNEKKGEDVFTFDVYVDEKENSPSTSTSQTDDKSVEKKNMKNNKKAKKQKQNDANTE